MSKTYRIVRLFETGELRTLRTGIPRALADRHCSDPESSSTTATGPFAREFTRRNGGWIDCYQKEA